NSLHGRVRTGRRVACLVVPGLKVHGLAWADTEQDAQHFRIADPLRQRGVEAGAPLLDKPKMEARCVGNRLEVIRDGRGSPRFKPLQVPIVSGNGRKLPFQQTRDGWWERVTEIGVLRAA